MTPQLPQQVRDHSRNIGGLPEKADCLEHIVWGQLTSQDNILLTTTLSMYIFLFFYFVLLLFLS